MKYFGRAARMEPCKRIGTGCTIYALPVSKILNKEIRVLQCESLGAGISFPRLGRRGYAPQRNVARPRRTQRKLQQYIKAFPTPRALTKRPYKRTACINTSSITPNIPLHRFTNTRLKGFFRFPTKFIGNFTGINGIAPIMPGAVGNVGNKLSV